MFRRKIPCAWSCLALALALTAPSARADAPDAKDLFEQARGLRLEGHCESALPLFRRAYGMYPAGLGSLRNIAECEEELGHFASSRRAWLDLQRALNANDQSKYAGWEQDAALAAARLAPKRGALIVDARAVSVSGRPMPATAIRVSVNGEVLTPDRVGRPIDADPGRYVLRAEGVALGVSEERVIDLAAGEERQVILPVVVPAPRSGDAMSSPTLPPPTAAWIAAGIGAASLVGAGVAAVKRQSALDDLNAECGSTTSCLSARNNQAESSKVQEVEDRGHAATTWVNVLAIVGIVGLSSGVVLYATARSHPSRTALLLSPAGISVAGSY